MTLNIKYVIAGLIIIAATVLVASQQLYTPKPPTLTEPQELAVAQRVCEKANIIIAGSEPAIMLKECLEENARCVSQSGPHAVWAGPAPGGFSTCACEENYYWLNEDRTTGTSYGPGLTLDTISAPGKCVARQ